MTAETLFLICNAIALTGWAFIIFAPRWQLGIRLISSCIIPSLLAIIYLYLAVSYESKPGGGFSSLAKVAILFEEPYLLLAGWVHYLAFDLFVGCWELRDSQSLNISHWLMIPCLLLTLLFGPSGLLLYFVVRGAARKQFLLAGQEPTQQS